MTLGAQLEYRVPVEEEEEEEEADTVDMVEEDGGEAGGSDSSRHLVKPTGLNSFPAIVSVPDWVYETNEPHTHTHTHT